MYQWAEQIIRPTAPSDVTVCKGIMSWFSFLFLGVPRHYAKRPFICWCQACSRVRGRGLGSQSSGPHLLVAGCTRSNQTGWTEVQFTVTSSSGIQKIANRNHVHFFKKSQIAIMFIFFFGITFVISFLFFSTHGTLNCFRKSDLIKGSMSDLIKGSMIPWPHVVTTECEVMVSVRIFFCGYIVCKVSTDHVLPVSGQGYLNLKSCLSVLYHLCFRKSDSKES
jgi:hypothetical protein